MQWDMLIFTPSLALVVAIEQGVSQVDIQLFLYVRVLCCFASMAMYQINITSFSSTCGLGKEDQ